MSTFASLIKIKTMVCKHFYTKNFISFLASPWWRNTQYVFVPKLFVSRKNSWKLRKSLQRKNGKKLSSIEIEMHFQTLLFCHFQLQCNFLGSCYGKFGGKILSAFWSLSCQASRFSWTFPFPAKLAKEVDGGGFTPIFAQHFVCILLTFFSELLLNCYFIQNRFLFTPLLLKMITACSKQSLHWYLSWWGNPLVWLKNG